MIDALRRRPRLRFALLLAALAGAVATLLSPPTHQHSLEGTWRWVERGKDSCAYYNPRASGWRISPPQARAAEAQDWGSFFVDPLPDGVEPADEFETSTFTASLRETLDPACSECAVANTASARIGWRERPGFFSGYGRLEVTVTVTRHRKACLDCFERHRLHLEVSLDQGARGNEAYMLRTVGRTVGEHLREQFGWGSAQVSEFGPVPVGQVKPVPTVGSGNCLE